MTQAQRPQPPPPPPGAGAAAVQQTPAPWMPRLLSLGPVSQTPQEPTLPQLSPPSGNLGGAFNTPETTRSRSEYRDREERDEVQWSIRSTILRAVEPFTRSRSPHETSVPDPDRNISDFGSLAGRREESRRRPRPHSLWPLLFLIRPPLMQVWRLLSGIRRR